MMEKDMIILEINKMIKEQTFPEYLLHLCAKLGEAYTIENDKLRKENDELKTTIRTFNRVMGDKDED